MDDRTLRWQKVVRRGTWGLVGVGALVACTKVEAESPPVHIVVRTDLAIPADLDSLSIEAYVQGARISSELVTLGPKGTRLPEVFTLRPGPQAGSKPVRFVAVGYAKGRPVVVRSAVSRVPQHGGTIVLPLHYLCRNSASIRSVDPNGGYQEACGENQTCRSGQCGDAEIPNPDTLPPFSPNVLYGSDSPTCLDVEGCFRGLPSVAPRVEGESCFVEGNFSNPGRLNVALRPPKQDVGFCDNGTQGCLVPLDTDPAQTSMRVSGTRLELPEGACKEPDLRVVVSARCLAKKDTVPSCGAGTSVDKREPVASPEAPSPLLATTSSPTPDHCKGTEAPCASDPGPSRPPLDAGPGNADGGSGPSDSGPDATSTPRDGGDGGSDAAPASDGQSGPSFPLSMAPLRMTAGDNHTCVLMADGTVRCWLVDPNLQPISAPGRASVPWETIVGGSSLTESVPGLSGVVQIAAGKNHTCALVQDGTVYCWGCDWNNQVTGTGTSSATPLRVPTVSGAVEIGAGGYTSCARFANGTVYCWGDNSNGQLGGSSPTSPAVGPIRSTVSDLQGAIQLELGFGHTCVRMADGHARCWGRNEWLQCGQGSRTTNDIEGVDGVEQIVAGSTHTCALMQDKTIRCWGSYRDGQVKGSSERIPIADFIGLSATQLAAGDDHNCAVFSDGSVRCWGRSAEGQLGGPSTNTPIAGLDKVVEVVAGTTHSCARRLDGTVRCWGKNLGGAPDGSNGEISIPGL